MNLNKKTLHLTLAAIASLALIASTAHAQSLPDPAAVKAALQAERDKFPTRTISEAQMGAILNAVALQFPFTGMHRKDGQAPQPGTGIGISHDVLRVMPPGDPLGYWSDVLGASGVGIATPLAPEWKRSSDGRESFVPPVPIGPTPPPPPPPPTSAGVTRAELDAAIARLALDLRIEIGALLSHIGDRVLALEARPPLDLSALQAAIDAALLNYEVNGKTATDRLGLQHQVKLAITRKK